MKKQFMIFELSSKTCGVDRDKDELCCREIRTLAKICQITCRREHLDSSVAEWFKIVAQKQMHESVCVCVSHDKTRAVQPARSDEHGIRCEDDTL